MPKTCRFLYPPLKNQPTPNIENLAKHAKSKKTFRTKACKRQDFKKAVKDEAETGGVGHFECLTREELAFVDGWIYATEHEYVDSNGNIDDAKLLDAIRRHVPDSGYGPMSGDEPLSALSLVRSLRRSSKGGSPWLRK